jgi:hypothetical protein
MNEAAAPTEDFQQAHTHPQASFMGLPPELRMYIYGYLVNGGRIMDPGAAGHTCMNTSNGYRNHYTPSPLKCPCTEKVCPQILATNSTIYMEAMPVLYSSTEFHVSFPTWLDRPTSIRARLRNLPESGIVHIKRIALIGLDNRMVGHNLRTSYENSIADSSKWLTSHNIKPIEVRLCMGMLLGSLGDHNLHGPAFSDLLILPRVNKLLLEVPCIIRGGEDSQQRLAYYGPRASAAILDSRHKLIAALRARAQTLGVGVDIEDVSSDEWRDWWDWRVVD